MMIFPYEGYPQPDVTNVTFPACGSPRDFPQWRHGLRFGRKTDCVLPAPFHILPDDIHPIESSHALLRLDAEIEQPPPSLAMPGSSKSTNTLVRLASSFKAMR